MNLGNLIKPEAILPALKADSKKQAIQELAAKGAAITGLPERDIFDSLQQRERLGSTGVGLGVAIPHCKLVPIKNISGLFARLEEPIEFDSLDNQPVDLIFVLLAPEGAGADHLTALSQVVRLLRNAPIAAKLRATNNGSALYSILTESPEFNAA